MKEHPTGRFFATFVGDPRQLSLEKRVFIIFSLLTGLVLILLSIQELLVTGLFRNAALNAVIPVYFALGLVFTLFYLLCRFRGTHTPLVVPTLLLSHAVLAWGWFATGGSRYSGPYFFIMAVVLGIILVGRRLRWWYFGAFILFTLTILYLEFTHPDWVTFSMAETTRRVDSATSLLVCIVINGIAFIALFRNYNMEQEKSDRLLLNVLPLQIAEELKRTGKARAVHFDVATVLFADFKGFTLLTEKMQPGDLIQKLDSYFSHFDLLTEKYGLEKLKTIGDSYMCAGGIPAPDPLHPLNIVLAALEIQDYTEARKRVNQDAGLPFWELRIGIHCGPLIAGVVGKRKFAYDIWGDTVNTAAGCESSGLVGQINISDDLHSLVGPYFECEARGMIEAKHKGRIHMYLVHRLRQEYSKDGDGRVPTDSLIQSMRAPERIAMAG
jgi:adenylate cyclase